MFGGLVEEFRGAISRDSKNGPRSSETPGEGPAGGSPSSQQEHGPPPLLEAGPSSRAAPALSASVPEMSPEHATYRAAVDGKFTETMTASEFRGSLSERADIPDRAKEAIEDKLNALEEGGADLNKVYITEYQHRVPDELLQNQAIRDLEYYTTQISVVDMTLLYDIVQCGESSRICPKH